MFNETIIMFGGIIAILLAIYVLICIAKTLVDPLEASVVTLYVGLTSMFLFFIYCLYCLYQFILYIL